MPYAGSWRNVCRVIIRRFRETFRLHLQGGQNQLARNSVSSNLHAEISRSLVLSTLIIIATCSCGLPVLTRATRRHMPEDGILPSHRHENLKSYIVLHTAECSTGSRYSAIKHYSCFKSKVWVCWSVSPNAQHTTRPGRLASPAISRSVSSNTPLLPSLWGRGMQQMLIFVRVKSYGVT
jgi:hypothetical protein